MLSEKNIAAISNLAHEMDEKQLAWASGFFAGMQTQRTKQPTATQEIVATASSTAEAIAEKATVLYGSQSGNGKNIAEALVQDICAGGIDATALNLASYKTAQLKKEQFLFIVISTHGEGDPPDSALAFFSFLRSRRAPQLPKLRFAVLALGDSSYEFFCQAGRDFRARLQELGATEITAITECDSDFDNTALQWRQTVIKTFTDEIKPDNTINGVATLNYTAIVTPDALPYSRQNPFLATVLANINLTDDSANGHAYHIELSLEDSGLTYEPGDSLGICPENPLSLAKRVAELLNTDWETAITLNNETLPLGEWLTQHVELTRLSPQSLHRYGEACNIAELTNLTPKSALAWLYGRNVADVFLQYPPPAPAEQILGTLRRLTPRLYSLASSQTARETEAHLLLALSSYTTQENDKRWGLCSGYLPSLADDMRLKVYVHANTAFHLPKDDDTPIIMIGPGSGVAPFRAFMEEREERHAKGKNWLFFGCRHRRNGFYYQSEWLEYIKSGLLTSMDVAFSRDGTKKVYVQHLMQKHGAEIWHWLQDGAHVYVCGDEARMAKDVHAALIALIIDNGGVDGEEYIAKITAEGRYRRDVY